MITSLDFVAFLAWGSVIYRRVDRDQAYCAVCAAAFGMVPVGSSAWRPAVAAILVGVALPPELVIDGNNSYQGAAMVRDFSPCQRRTMPPVQGRRETTEHPIDSAGYYLGPIWMVLGYLQL